MDFTRPQDYVDALKEFEGFPCPVRVGVGRRSVPSPGRRCVERRPRVRIDASRIPFTVGCVDVNPDDGFDMLRIFAADPGDRKPVVMFRLDQGILNRKDRSFNVI